MADSSVDSYINAQPETIMDQDQYYQNWMHENYPTWSDSQIGHYGDANYKVAKFFGDNARNRFDSGKYYETYVANMNNRNELLATQSARAWDKMMDDTKVQRAFKDYEAAGLNPYLLVNSGSNISSSAPSSSKSDYGYKLAQSDKKNGRDTALIILALARLAAALL